MTLKQSATELKERSVGRMLKLLSLRMDGWLSEELHPFGLNIPRFVVLMTLFERDGLSQSEVGKRIAMAGYGTTRNVDALVDRKLVVRRPNPESRRSHRIFLTGKARSLGPRLFAKVAQANERLMASLDASEKQQFSRILTKML